MRTLSLNSPRSGAPGTVESFFVRANDPARPRALWLKATVLVPQRAPAVADLWFIWFDDALPRPLAMRRRQPLASASFGRHRRRSIFIQTDHGDLVLAPEGGSHGALNDDAGKTSWSFSWQADAPPLGEPLWLLPLPLRLSFVPRFKLVTPFPSLRFQGEVRVGGEPVSLDGWSGMQGHNWGREHAFEYAWGACAFPGDGERPPAVVEGFSARLAWKGCASPLLSSLVVRRGGETWACDRLVDVWRQSAAIDFPALAWRARLKCALGTVELEMEASQRRTACLGYENPDGSMAYCLNSKVARARLVLRGRDGSTHAYQTEHLAALELLRRRPDDRFHKVI